MSLFHKFLGAAAVTLALSAKGCNVEEEPDVMTINIVRFPYVEPKSELPEKPKLPSGGALFSLPIYISPLEWEGFHSDHENTPEHPESEPIRIIKNEEFQKALDDGRVTFDIDDEGNNILEITPEFAADHPELMRRIQDEYDKKYPPVSPDIQP